MKSKCASPYLVRNDNCNHYRFDYMNSLSNMEEEFAEYDEKNSWQSVYQDIRNASTSYSFTVRDARKNENKNLNRYRDVNPFDHSRVRLKRGDKDYINASLVQVPAANRSYILTQGPLKATTGHFWLMVWEQQSKAILMLNRVIEKNAVKCYQYWPVGSVNGGDNELLLSDVGLLVSFVSEEEAQNYVIRKFLLLDFETGKSRTVLQFHYTTWPDFGVPGSPAAFLNFLFAVRDADVLNEHVGPAVVHCSAGIGRSGTFCLVDSCLVLIEKSGSAKSINIRELLLDMRKYRMGLIQTPDQLRFSYMAIIVGSKVILKKKDDALVPSEEVCVEKVLRKEGKISEEIVPQSDSSDEGIANSNTLTSTLSTSTPPPLPPRPAHNDFSSASCNSASDSPLMPDNSVESLFVNSISPCTSDGNKNEFDQSLTSEKCEINAGNEEKLSKRNDLQNSVSSDLDSLRSEASSPDQESAAELRKRKRLERSEKLSAMVRKMKKKKVELDLWEKRRSLIKRISLGLVLLLGTGVLVYKYYSKG